MVHHTPRHVRPDAYGAVPIVVNVTGEHPRAVRRRALLPHIACDLKGVRRLGHSSLSDREERPRRPMDDGIAERDVGGGVARDSGEPTVAEAHIGNFYK